MKLSKSGLAIILSRLSSFESPKSGLEQYPTDSEIAAETLWLAAMNSDIQDCAVADLGCGTGILGIGALLLGAAKVFFIDLDSDALETLKQNLKSAEELSGEELISRAEVIHSDISGMTITADTVIENPPFGVKDEHADREFLEKAFQSANVVYSIHKAESNDFINKISARNAFRITHHLEFDFPIKKTMAHHSKRIYRFKAGMWRLEKL
jgi:putative methylase